MIERLSLSHSLSLSLTLSGSGCFDNDRAITHGEAGDVPERSFPNHVTGTESQRRGGEEGVCVLPAVCTITITKLVG